MRIAVLFAGRGGSSYGYHLAFPGAEIVGVDLRSKGSYPFTFVRADAMTFPLDGFDLVHASPPCQRYSIATAGADRSVIEGRYPDLIGAVRERLRASGVPYVIENVPRAPLRDPLTLCGTMFDLTATDDDGTPLFLRRHRLFESSFLANAPGPCRCRERQRTGAAIAGVYGGARSDRWEAKHVRHGGYVPASLAVRRALMGIPWMSARDLNLAVPPAYTEWIGCEARRQLRVAA